MRRRYANQVDGNYLVKRFDDDILRDMFIIVGLNLGRLLLLILGLVISVLKI